MKHRYICAGCGRFRFNRDYQITWHLANQSECKCGSSTVREDTKKISRSMRRYRKRPDKLWRRHRRLRIRMKRLGPGAVTKAVGLCAFPANGPYGCNAFPTNPSPFEIDLFLRKWNRGKLYREWMRQEEESWPIQTSFTRSASYPSRYSGRYVTAASM